MGPDSRPTLSLSLSLLIAARLTIGAALSASSTRSPAFVPTLPLRFTSGGQHRQVRGSSLSFLAPFEPEFSLWHRPSRLGLVEQKTPCSSSGRIRTSMMASGGLYGIEGAAWSSPSWNWGSAIGTGHDCARIFRNNFSARGDREAYLATLRQATEEASSDELEEAKLALCLTIQRACRSGHAGPTYEPEGMYAVMDMMAKAERYEGKGAGERLVTDLAHSYSHMEEVVAGRGDAKAMEALVGGKGNELKAIAMALQGMKFAELGC